MKHRCYDIIVEDDQKERSITDEFVLDLPSVSMETAMERQEFLGFMYDTLVATSGLNICSFRSEIVVSE